ncbi:MAG TPA: RdgB/HAM1 family non-canonical purine NTP pyrophosphatase [Polyangiales bacterium]
MKLLVATTNPHKVREIGQVLTPLGIEVCGLSELGVDLPEPVEDAATFEGNARIKALAYARALKLPCLADDSGLEVDALGGAPGVHSARYAGVGATREERDRANNEKLIRELRKLGNVDRSARFVCALCLVDADGRVLFEGRGTFAGVITDEPRGENGFGYDPHLLLPDVGKTSAELPSDQKNARSHRGAATRALHAWLVNHPL